MSKGVPGSRATDVASAVADADVVVLAVPFAALDQTLARAGDLRGRIVPPPRRWKMAVITLGALYPIVLALSTALRRLAGGWPLPVALLLSLGLTISLMTWVVVPALTTQLGPWLRR